MSSCRSWYEIEDYAEDWEDSIKTIYRKLSGDTTDYEVPTHDTLNRVVSLLDPEHFEKAYRTWLMSFLPIGDEKHLYLDGKTMRGVKKLDFEHSAHVVSAYYTELSHGRIETRAYELIAEPLSQDDNPILERWAGLKSVLRVSRRREDKKTGKASEETVYYISLIADLERLRQAIRSHWAIENNLHHCLDVYLGQDASHKRLGNVPQIMDVVLKINLFILMHLREKAGLSIPMLQSSTHGFELRVTKLLP
ncbi:MAG: ISAs1 family transposase [Porphyromonas sp.]|nr:ISAs1 family transposase [Porphyromonas sp.]